MMKKRIKQGGALILAAVLIMAAFVIPKTYAAIGVDVDAECKLTVDITNEGMKEIVEGSVKVDLYRVAAIEVTGAYTSLVEGLDFSGINSETKATEWEALAASAATIVGETTPTYTQNTAEGVAVFDGIDTGLYLVYARTMKSDINQYDFTPYLISMPNNYYYTTNDDTWVYDFTVDVKPSKSDLYGDLVIRKTVDVFNASLGEATFVFQVEAKKVDVDDASVRVVYSDVVALKFDGTGTKEVYIDNIPAGAEVTVTEVYSGASYATNSAVKETVIIADDLEGAPATVDFLNTYSGELNGGSGLVNNFTHNGTEWTVNATEDSTRPVE